MAVGQMVVGQMALGQMAVGQMFSDQKAWNLLYIFQLSLEFIKIFFIHQG
jgi:hypothetical protein